MQLSMGYDRIDGKKLIILLCTLFLGITLKSQSQDFSRVKSKYDFKTDATERLAELVTAKKYDEALEFANEEINKASKNAQYEELVLLIERKADLFRRLLQFEEGEKTATEAIQIAIEKLGQNHILLAKSYLTRGIIEHRKNDFYTASSNFDSSQVIYENSIQYDSLMYDRIIEYKYYAYTYTEKNADTLRKYIDKRFKSVLDNPKSTTHDIIYYMHDYPKLYRETGDFYQALAYSIAEVVYANENIETIEAKDHTSAYYNLIHTLNSMKKYDLALAICEDALSFYNSDSRFKESINLIDIQALRPSILMSLKEYNKAINYYIELISSFDNSIKPNEIKFQSQLQISLASCYIAIGDNDRANEYLDISLNKIKSINRLPDKQAASLFRIKGDYYKSEIDFKNAFLSYDSAVKNGIPEYFLDSPLDFPVIQDQKISFTVLLDLKEKAISLSKLFQNEFSDSLVILSSINQYVLNSHSILMERRKELMRTEGKLFLSDNFRALYETGITSAYWQTLNNEHEEGIKKARDFFKMSKSILFLEQAGEFEEINTNNIPQYLKEHYYDLSNETKEMNNEFFSKFNSGNLLSDSIKVLNSRLLESSRSLAKLKDSIGIYKRLNNELFTPKNNEQPLKRGQLSLDFFVADTSIFILGKTNNEEFLEMVKLDSTLLQNIENVIQEVSSSPKFTNYKNLLSNFIGSSNYVFEKLLAPILNQVNENITTITIIPDDFLSRLPFEVLLTDPSTESSSFKNLPYLIRSYTINYQLTRAGDMLENSKTAKKEILGIGYSSKNSSDGNAEVGLPGTTQEIKQLQANFNGDYYLGEDATKGLFLQEAHNFDILHLAVHGETDQYGKYDARLIFNGGDSLLNTADLYLANIQARMVVLSACESGTGEVIKGEGTFSIARGFALIGVPSIIMSLWNVNDKVTSELMTGFYEYISLGQSSVDALNLSKISYLESSDAYTSHPYYWSSFISLGDPIELYPSSNEFSIWVLAVLLMTVVVLLIWFYAKQKRRRTN
jgi:CHAT domain-containing protein